MISKSQIESVVQKLQQLCAVGEFVPIAGVALERSVIFFKYIFSYSLDIYILFTIYL